MIKIDARGDACPLPVVKAKKAIAELNGASEVEILVDNEETCIRIPMIGDIRSLNLSNSVAIVLYEALRQHNFETMNLEGHLHRLHWKSE